MKVREWSARLPTVADPLENPQFERISALLLREAPEEALVSLSASEAKVLRRRNGFSDGQVYTLQAIGADLGLTREHVRQIEATVLQKLRDFDEAAHRLRRFLDEENTSVGWAPASSIRLCGDGVAA